MSDKRPSGIIPGFCLMSSVRFLKYAGPGILSAGPGDRFVEECLNASVPDVLVQPRPSFG